MKIKLASIDMCWNYTKTHMPRFFLCVQSSYFFLEQEREEEEEENFYLIN